LKLWERFSTAIMARNLDAKTPRDAMGSPVFRLSPLWDPFGMTMLPARH